jgi:5-methylcytosine-specific restriction endonuclease McrA
MYNPLDTPVLVLDKQYHPVKIITAKEAVHALFSEEEKVKVLDSTYTTYTIDEWIEYSKMVEQKTLPVIHSVNVDFIVPEVIVLPNYLRKPQHGKKLRYSRASIFKRDGHACQYCGGVKPRNELTVDHIIPKSRGGRSNWLNITTACKPCNWKKADRTPDEAGMKLLSTPRIPTWKDSLELPANFKHDVWNNFL